MKSLILYTSKYGATQKAATRLKSCLANETDLINIKKANNLDLTEYKQIMIGGSIYMGKIQKSIIEFCNKNYETLKDKKLGFFVCCGSKEKAEAQIRNSLDNKLLENAEAIGYFGYEYNLNKINFFYKLIIKKVAGITKSQSNIIEKNIEEFADKFNE